MSEGPVHASLVKELLLVLHASLDRPSIYADVPGANADSKPPRVGGFVPDIFVSFPRLIIGEAKTKTDLDTRHSREQLRAFLIYLAQEPDGLLILAVPLHALNYAKSVIQAAKAYTSTINVPSLCICPDYSLLGGVAKIIELEKTA